MSQIPDGDEKFDSTILKIILVIFNGFLSYICMKYCSV